jgi:hypothetical protein
MNPPSHVSAPAPAPTSSGALEARVVVRKRFAVDSCGYRLVYKTPGSKMSFAELCESATDSQL